MAYDAKKLELIAGGGAGISLWGYRSTDDALAAVDGSGYFNGAATMLKQGDWLLINASDGSGLFICATNDGATVDLSNATTVGATNSD